MSVILLTIMFIYKSTFMLRGSSNHVLHLIP